MPPASTTAPLVALAMLALPLTQAQPDALHAQPDALNAVPYPNPKAWTHAWQASSLPPPNAHTHATLDGVARAPTTHNSARSVAQRAARSHDAAQPN